MHEIECRVKVSKADVDEEFVSVGSLCSWDTHKCPQRRDVLFGTLMSGVLQHPSVCRLCLFEALLTLIKLNRPYMS